MLGQEFTNSSTAARQGTQVKPAERESRLMEILSAASGPMNARQIAEAIEPGNLTTLMWCRKVLPLMVADGRLVKSQDPNFAQTCHAYSLAAHPVAAEVMEPEAPTETATVESQALSLFNYKSLGAVRVAMIDGAPWFCLNDVCEVLLIANPRNVAARLDEDEKGAVHLCDAIGRYQKTTFVNESGLYTVVLRSDKPEAKPFRKWITSEVIPTIRKTGSYSVSQPAPEEQKPLSQLEMLSLMAQEAVKQEKRLAEVETKVDRLLLRREQAEKDLAALPPATVKAAPKTTRALVAELVANYCKATSVEFVDAHRKLHKEFYYRHHINLNKRFLANRDKYKTKLDIVEELGMMEQYYAIALEVLVAPKEGSADL